MSIYDKWHENCYATQCVGMLRREVEVALEINMEEKKILIYPSTLKHIRTRHPHVYREYLKKLPEILAEPDYVGISFENPTRLEFIKEYKECLLVALKIDSQGNLYVSSMYAIDKDRIEKRLSYGRLKNLEINPVYKKKKQRYRNNCKK